MGAVAEMSQVNARIETKVKMAGDRALASAGITPSHAIRALWAKAAKRGKDLEEVRSFIESASDEPDSAADAEKRFASLEAARLGVLSALKEMGVADAETAEVPYEPLGDALGDVLWERLEERGLA